MCRTVLLCNDAATTEIYTGWFVGSVRWVYATAVATPLRSEADTASPAVVKVVVDGAGYALYFSRLPIPYSREGRPVERLKHIGMYANRRAFLPDYARMEPTPLEVAESLEQLRAVENGVRCFSVRSDHDAISVDTAEDLERVRAETTRVLQANQPQGAERQSSRSATRTPTVDQLGMDLTAAARAGSRRRCDPGRPARAGKPPSGRRSRSGTATPSRHPAGGGTARPRATRSDPR